MQLLPCQPIKVWARGTQAIQNLYKLHLQIPVIADVAVDENNHNKKLHKSYQG